MRNMSDYALQLQKMSLSNPAILKGYTLEGYLKCHRPPVTDVVVMDTPRRKPKDFSPDCLSKKVIAREIHNDLRTKSVLYDRFFEFEHPSTTSVGPALQVLSISLIRNDPTVFKIFGEIFATDYQDKVFYFYKCDGSQPQLVSHCGMNSLDLTRVPVAPLVGGHVSFRLFIESGIPIFDNSYDINEAVENHDEGTFTLEGIGGFGFGFKMIFTKTPFAILARVSMILKAPPPPSSRKETFKLSGKIVANKVVCFQASSSSGCRGSYGVYNGLDMSTHVLVVPVSYRLMVDVRLYNERLGITENIYAVYPAENTMESPNSSWFKCDDDDYRFCMDVGWILQPDFFSQPDVQAIDDPRMPIFKEYNTSSSRALVEVYSVFVGGASSLAQLCGKILVLDSRENFYIFARDNESPDMLSSSSNEEQNNEKYRTLSIAWPNRWVSGKGFNMYLKLKDVENNMVCRGELTWSNGRYNSRLCDVIKGENGHFAAVHYSVFKNGKRAKVSVECHNFGSQFRVYGSVYAEYDNYCYLSAHDKQCYRSVLFERSKEKHVKVKRFFDLPLWKSHISAPPDCEELIVYVDLWIRPSKTSLRIGPSKTSSEYEQFQFNTADAKFHDVGTGRVVVKVNWF